MFEDAGEVEAFTVLRDARVKPFQVYFANLGRARKELERVDVHAELFECDKGRLVVVFHNGKRIDVQDVGERVEADVLDGDASADHFFGMIFDIAAGYLGSGKKDDEVEKDQGS